MTKSKTFKDIEKNKNIDKLLKKSGLSLAIIFSKEDLDRFNLGYGDVIRLNLAQIIKAKV